MSSSIPTETTKLISTSYVDYKPILKTLLYTAIIAIIFIILFITFKQNNLRSINKYNINPPKSLNSKMNQPNVKLNECNIFGKWDQYNLNVAQFYSIPYIIPPINNLRWKNPILLKNYSDATAINHGICKNNIINATYHHSRCWQNFLDVSSSKYPPQNEDCVHLDIYSPSYNTTKSLSVFVFFHGGSSTSGGNFQYDFTNFSKELNVVVVVPNYRLNLFGFLTFKELTETSETNTSGNYGLFDLYTSLKWIKQYINKFGGNPNDITISGQSTGGTAVLIMLSSLKAKGLFNRAISMSSSPNISFELQAAEKQGIQFVDLFGCNEYKDNTLIVSCMQSIEAENLSNAYPAKWVRNDAQIFALPSSNKTGMHEEGLMIVDGDLMTESVFAAFSKGINVPLLIGDTQYEAAWAPVENMSNLTTESEFGDYLNNHFKEFGDNFGVTLWKSYYQKEWELGGAQLVYDAISTDGTIFCGNKYLLTLAANSTNYNQNLYLFSSQQWPGNRYICNADTNYQCLYSFHGFDFMTATYNLLSFDYWGAAPYEANVSDHRFGELLRNHWKHFIQYDEPLSSWKSYNKYYYETALLGNGPNKFTQYNLTNMTSNYKSAVCDYYLQNGIGASFWWSN